MKKVFTSILLVLFLFGSIGIETFAVQSSDSSSTYTSYTYNGEWEPVAVPSPFTALASYTGNNLGCENFASVTDIFYSNESNRIYITDQERNTVFIFDGNFKFITDISSFEFEGKKEVLSSPQSTVERNGLIFIADSGNQRILAVSAIDYSIVKIYTKPKIDQLGEYTYNPTALCVDMAGRIYVVASGINKGLLLLDENGEFQSFIGAPDVTVDFLDSIWKKILGKAQKSGLLSAVPTEYNSVSIDEDGFLYATTQSEDVESVVRLNTQGENVLRYEGEEYPNGDGWYSENKNLPQIIDLALDDKGNYYALDGKSGRIYTYDSNGTLLYAFGGIGTQVGKFYSPVAIEYINGYLVVVDGFYGRVTLLERTEFGKNIYLAQGYMELGEYNNAEALWNKVLLASASYVPAQIGIGRIETYKGNYKSAMKKLEYAGSTEYYSEAFDLYRKELAREYFSLIVVVLVALAAVAVALYILNNQWSLLRKFNSLTFVQEYRYSSYTSFHPFDGYWDLKREKKGSLRAANALFGIFVIMLLLRIQTEGFLFRSSAYEEVNAVSEALKFIIPLLLWCISNWCFTTLMDGEGSLKDIYIALCYSLKPYIITAIPMMLLSHFLTLDEVFIYTTLESIIWFWVLALIFFGMITTHDYTVKKGILTAILSVVGICLIIFIGLVFSNVIEDFYEFVGDIYRELMYRTY